ncbi:hypothetical protein EV291_109119 [Rhizobium sp. BK068]|nr:hypothetical protein EV291_109119 [Rhizobium sp. BK068]
MGTGSFKHQELFEGERRRLNRDNDRTHTPFADCSTTLSSGLRSGCRSTNLVHDRLRILNILIAGVAMPKTSHNHLATAISIQR